MGSSRVSPGSSSSLRRAPLNTSPASTGSQQLPNSRCFGRIDDPPSSMRSRMSPTNAVTLQQSSLALRRCFFVLPVRTRNLGRSFYGSVHRAYHLDCHANQSRVADIAVQPGSPPSPFAQAQDSRRSSRSLGANMHRCIGDDSAGPKSPGFLIAQKAALRRAAHNHQGCAASLAVVTDADTTCADQRNGHPSFSVWDDAERRTRGNVPSVSVHATWEEDSRLEVSLGSISPTWSNEPNSPVKRRQRSSGSGA